MCIRDRRRSGQNHASYEEANTLITAYLNKNLKYSEKDVYKRQVYTCDLGRDVGGSFTEQKEEKDE